MDTIKKHLEIQERMGNVNHLQFHLSISRYLGEGTIKDDETGWEAPRLVTQ